MDGLEILMLIILIASRNNQDLVSKNFFGKLKNILSWEKKNKKICF